MITYSPSVEEQMAASQDGVSGQFVVQYDVQRDLDAGEIQVGLQVLTFLEQPIRLQHLGITSHILFLYYYYITLKDYFYIFVCLRVAFRHFNTHKLTVSFLAFSKMNTFQHTYVKMLSPGHGRVFCPLLCPIRPQPRPSKCSLHLGYQQLNVRNQDGAG